MAYVAEVAEKFGPDAAVALGKALEQDTQPLMSPRREAAINFVNCIQVDYLLAASEDPCYTATRTRRGPFARIARECLRLLKGPVDDIALINMLQARSHKMTDRKGQERRDDEKKKRDRKRLDDEKKKGDRPE
jgi:hypothetical protein